MPENKTTTDATQLHGTRETFKSNLPPTFKQAAESYLSQIDNQWKIMFQYFGDMDHLNQESKEIKASWQELGSLIKELFELKAVRKNAMRITCSP